MVTNLKGIRDVIRKQAGTDTQPAGELSTKAATTRTMPSGAFLDFVKQWDVLWKSRYPSVTKQRDFSDALSKDALFAANIKAGTKYFPVVSHDVRVSLNNLPPFLDDAVKTSLQNGAYSFASLLSDIVGVIQQRHGASGLHVNSPSFRAGQATPPVAELEWKDGRKKVRGTMTGDFPAYYLSVVTQGGDVELDNIYLWKTYVYSDIFLDRSAVTNIAKGITATGPFFVDESTSVLIAGEVRRNIFCYNRKFKVDGEEIEAARPILLAG